MSERGNLEEAAKADARAQYAEHGGQLTGLLVYTDGLGVMGVGSAEGGEASIRNVAFRSEWQRLAREAQA